MIDQVSPDGTGWARLSDDMTMRYRLARSHKEGVARMLSTLSPGEFIGARCVWVLCNPSDADALEPDPTLGECVKFSTAWGFGVTELVNLWALRSPYPADLRKYANGWRGDDEVNDQAILDACTGATIVVAAWGTNGALDHRAAFVRGLLNERGVKLHHLGLTKDGWPKHPLARGKHRIPSDQKPIPWSQP